MHGRNGHRSRASRCPPTTGSAATRVGVRRHVHRRLPDRRVADRRGRAGRRRTTPTAAVRGRACAAYHAGARCRRRSAPRSSTAIADGVEARVPELAAVETRDNGSLLRSMRNSVMPRVARNFRFFADQLLELDTGAKDYDGFAERVAWDPSGVAAVITPWNAPLMLATWRVAPGPGRGERGGAEAARVGAAHGVDAGRHRARGGAARRRVQRASRGSARRPAPRSSRTPASTGSRSPAPSRPASSWRRPPAPT